MVMKKIDFTQIKMSSLLIVTALVTGVVILMTKTNLWHYIVIGFSPLILSFFIAYFLDYFARIFEKRLKMPRWLALICTFIIVGLFLTFFGMVIVPAVIEALISLFGLITKIKIDFSFFNFTFEAEWLNEFKDQFISAAMPMLQRLTSLTGTTLLKILLEVKKFTTGLISAFITLAVSIYMLIEKKDLIARVKRFVYAYFNERTVDRILNITQLSDKIFKGYIFGKFLDSLLIGVLTYLLLIIFQFKFAILIAVIVGITNMIPYFGPFIGAVPAIIITTVASMDHPIKILYICLLILAIQQLDGLVLGPLILGDSVGVSAFWIIVSVVCGGAIYGVIGMFLGVPVVVLLKSILENDITSKLEAKGYEAIELHNMKVKGKR